MPLLQKVEMTPKSDFCPLVEIGKVQRRRTFRSKLVKLTHKIVDKVPVHDGCERDNK